MNDYERSYLNCCLLKAMELAVEKTKRLFLIINKLFDIQYKRAVILHTAFFTLNRTADVQDFIARA